MYIYIYIYIYGRVPRKTRMKVLHRAWACRYICRHRCRYICGYMCSYIGRCICRYIWWHIRRHICGYLSRYISRWICRYMARRVRKWSFVSCSRRAIPGQWCLRCELSPRVSIAWPPKNWFLRNFLQFVLSESILGSFMTLQGMLDCVYWWHITRRAYSKLEEWYAIDRGLVAKRPLNDKYIFWGSKMKISRKLRIRFLI